MSLRAMDREDNSKNPLLAAYRDDPYHEGGSFESSHIPLRGQVPLEDDTPPAYTDAPSRSELQQRQVEFERPTSQTPPDESQDYNILYSKVTKNSKGSTITVISPLLTTDPKSLRSFIADERRLAPNPVIRIEGYHTETRRRDKKDETVNITDFDISISASDLFISHWRRTQVIENGIKAYRGGRTRSVAPGFKADLESTHTAPSLEEWYHRFCASGASLKTFTLNRRTTNLNEKLLSDTLNGVIRSTNYWGNVKITFPVEGRATILMSDHPFNRYRTNKWIWWSCVIFQLWIITWPMLWLMTKHWEVLTVNWPCRIYERAGQLPKADEEFPDQIHEGIRPEAWDVRNRGDMRIAFMSETTWVEEWRRAIVQAAESRKQGMLYPADRAAARSIEQRNVERALEYRQRTVVAGNGGFVDSTIGLVRGVSDAIRASQMAAGWGGNT